MRKKLLVSAMGLTTTLLLLGSGIHLWKLSETWEKYRRVQVGMTPNEVHAILGKPQDPGTPVAGQVWEDSWDCGDFWLNVYYDGSSVVMGKDTVPSSQWVRSGQYYLRRYFRP